MFNSTESTVSMQPRVKVKVKELLCDVVSKRAETTGGVDLHASKKHVTVKGHHNRKRVLF